MTNLSTNFPFSQTLLLISELSKQMHFNLGQRHSKKEESVLHAYLPYIAQPKGWCMGAGLENLLMVFLRACHWRSYNRFLACRRMNIISLSS